MSKSNYDSYYPYPYTLDGSTTERQFIVLAIECLVPGTNYTATAEGKITEWLDTEGRAEPTQAEIDAEVLRLKKEESDQEYARNRASDYPSTGDQMDMIYKDNKNSTTTHADAVEAVKTKWPKDNSGPV